MTTLPRHASPQAVGRTILWDMIKFILLGGFVAGVIGATVARFTHTVAEQDLVCGIVVSAVALGAGLIATYIYRYERQ